MRAPHERFVAYTDAQWERIAAVLARIDIDADALMLTDAGWGIWGGYTDRPYPLRDLRVQLEDFARSWVAPSLSTAEELAAVEIVLEMQLSRQAKEELEALAAKLRWMASEPPAPPALKWQRSCYLEGLIVLWLMLGGSRRRVDQIRFLHACASPVFPSTTRAAVRNFLDRIKRNAFTKNYLDGIERVSIE